MQLNRNNTSFNVRNNHEAVNDYYVYILKTFKSLSSGLRTKCGCENYKTIKIITDIHGRL